MIDSKYNKGVLTRVHYNGQGRSHWDYVNRHASIDEVMADGFFDLANRNRARPGQIVTADMVTPGDLIEVDAGDAAARVRVMSMDKAAGSLVVRAIHGPVYFDEAENLPGAAATDKAQPKRRGRQPLNLN